MWFFFLELKFLFNIALTFCTTNMQFFFMEVERRPETSWRETDSPSNMSTMLKKANDSEDLPLPVRPQIPT